MGPHPDHKLILASASPRRRELLREADINFEVEPAVIDETPDPDETASNCAERLARLKAEAVARLHPGSWVLGADTIVTLDGKILGKPESHENAQQVLSFLSGRKHQVVTAFAFCRYHPDSKVIHIHSKVVSSDVSFRDLTQSEIEEYVSSGEPLDKAGAYAIQGGASRFVSSFQGSWSNIVGLPIDEVVGFWKSILKNLDNPK